MAWGLDHVLLLTVSAVAIVCAVASAGFVLSRQKFPAHPIAGQIVTAALTLALAMLFAVSLDQAWGVRRERDRQAWTARDQHRQRIQALLRTEAAWLDDIARSLRDTGYFARVANEEREMIWHDDVLTGDVQHHYAEYFQDREQLIRRILAHNRDVERLRGDVSASLPLPEEAERLRPLIVAALVMKCAGAGPGNPEQAVAAAEAARTYEEYRCTTDVTRASQDVFDRASDLADAASIAGGAARRSAEETGLRGACTYLEEASGLAR
jgi:hypothetical protein